MRLLHPTFHAPPTPTGLPRLQPHVLEAATLCNPRYNPMPPTLQPYASQVSVPPFYAAFVLAPLASNAAGAMASYKYATKKTQKTITVSLAALEGAPCMDNTL